MADFTANKDELMKLSGTIGIDLQALKSKYTKEKSPEDIASKLFGPEDSTAQVKVSEEEEAKKRLAAGREANAKLDQYKVCQKCFGTGLEKYEYNHMRMERNCTECDGDGLMGVSKDMQAQEDHLKALSAEFGIPLTGSTEEKEGIESVMMDHDWLSDPSTDPEIQEVAVAPELI